MKTGQSWSRREVVGIGGEWQEVGEWGCRVMAGKRNGSKVTDGYVNHESQKIPKEDWKEEARLVVYKKNDEILEENIKILKLDIHLRDNALTELRKKLEKAKKERDEIKITLEKFENSSKTLNKMLDSQVNDKNKIDEYVVSESVTSVPSVETNEAKTSESKPKSISEQLIKDWISDSEDENETGTKSKHRKPSFAKVEFVKHNEEVKSPRESVKQEEHNRQAKHLRKNNQSPRGKARVETIPDTYYILLPLWIRDPPFYSSSKDSPGIGYKPLGEEEKKDTKGPRNEENKAPITKVLRVNQEKDSVNNTNRVNTVSSTINAASNEVNAVGRKSSIELPDDLNMHDLEVISIFEDSNKDVFGAEADLNNIETTFQFSPILISRIYKDHPVEQIIRDIHSAIQTKRMTKSVTDHDLPYGKRNIRTKWIYRNKKDERGIMVINKERLVAHSHTQEEGINYNEVFAPVARIKVIRLFLVYASFKDFVVYQMDVKIVFLYGKIEGEVYVYQPPMFEDPEFPHKVYKVEKALYGLHQALRAWKEMCTEFEKMMHKKFQMSSIRDLTFYLGLQVTQKDDGIFINQDKYVDEILKKFGFLTVKTTSTPMETSKPLMKDENAKDADTGNPQQEAANFLEVD
nr:copia protein [Tanacetum cinerariifolium]